MDTVIEAAVRLGLLTASMTIEPAAGTGLHPTETERAAIEGSGWCQRGSALNRIAEVAAATASIGAHAEAGEDGGATPATRH